ncbi:MAG: hypothetical protein KGI08_04615 [Thaumarchaeota archaeon]|nr:hypothetical protein [Nitrososphaerota archaeon]
MNCKQGDLAIVVKSTAGNEGKIVTCLKLFNKVPGRTDSHGPLWETDTALNNFNGLTGKIVGTTRYIPDSFLRPIKGLDELEDETNKELELVR